MTLTHPPTGVGHNGSPDAVGTSRQAIPMTFTAVLSGANELPNPVPSPGTGLATVVLDVSLGRCREAEAGRTE